MTERCKKETKLSLLITEIKYAKTFLGEMSAIIKPQCIRKAFKIGCIPIHINDHIDTENKNMPLKKKRN